MADENPTKETCLQSVQEDGPQSSNMQSCNINKIS